MMLNFRPAWQLQSIWADQSCCTSGWLWCKQNDRREVLDNQEQLGSKMGRARLLPH